MKVLEAVARTPEQERLHRAATDMHDENAVAELLDLVRGDFATLSTGNADESPEDDIGIHPQLKLREGDDKEAMIAAMIADVAQATDKEQVEIDERLMSLVVEPINALPEAQRTVKGRVRSGEEIAQAIPDVAAFLAEVDLQKENGILLDFFELNEEGQLVMKDNCKKPYGLSENALEARIRQTRIVYRDKDGKTQIMTGEKYFNVTKRDGGGRPVAMEVSQDALRIAQQTILMERGLPNLNLDGNTHSGEFARMQSPNWTWTDDKTFVKKDGSPDFARARHARWVASLGRMVSDVGGSGYRGSRVGSRGVLRVNLNFES